MLRRGSDPTYIKKEVGETNRLERQGSGVIRCKHGAYRSNRTDGHQRVILTHGRRPFDVSIDAIECRTRSAMDDIAHHSTSLGNRSIISPDEPVDATNDVEPG